MKNKNNAEADEKLYHSSEAALLLQEWFDKRAKWMTRENRSLREDVVQEMSVGILRIRSVHKLSFYKMIAVARGRDFMRQERQHRKKLKRFERLSHPKSETGEEQTIEDLVDLENRLSSIMDTPDVIQLFPDERACA